jgi:hypothetical protein
MKRSIAFFSIFLAASAYAFDTLGTESGTGSNKTAACRSAKQAAANKAQISASLNGNSKNKPKPMVGECECSQTGGGAECNVDWKVE